jgi:hypothetical protein
LEVYVRVLEFRGSGGERFRGWEKKEQDGTKGGKEGKEGREGRKGRKKEGRVEK